MHKQMRIIMTNIFQFLAIFALRFLSFVPYTAHLRHILPDTVAYILCKVMEYLRTNSYTILSSKINTTNIFQFLAIFAKNLPILPPKPEVPQFTEVYQM